MRIFILLLAALFSLNATGKADQMIDESELKSAFEVMEGRDFAAKEAALKTILNSGLENAQKIVAGVLEGDVMLVKKTNAVVFVEKKDRKYLATDVLTGEKVGEFSKRKLKKFSINNSLRSFIRDLLALQDLTNSDPEKRLLAVNTMLANPDASHQAILEPLLQTESDEAVKAAMQLSISLSKLSDDDPTVQLKAIGAVKESLEPAVRNKLKVLAETSSSVPVKKAAENALIKIDDRIELFGHLETLFFGISAGTVLVLAAIGLAITFGVMGVINMAHGELIMLGAYTTYLIQLVMPSMPGLSLALAIPGAFVVSGLVGIAIERGVIRFLYGRPLETLLATFGISLILQQLVRTLISPQNVPVANPEFMSGLLEINSVFSLTYNRLYIIAFCLLVFAVLFFVLKKTRLGLQVRAVSQNRAMARAMGVRSSRVDALTFGLGAGIAGVAGVALSQLTNVGPNLGQAYIVDSFMVVVFGGVGNLWGTLISGLGLGIANKFMEPWAGAVMAKILVLVFVILFIQKKPRGLFPQKGRAVEN